MDQMWSLFFQVRRIRYPITDDEDALPGDATSSYAGTHVTNFAFITTDRGDLRSNCVGKAYNTRPASRRMCQECNKLCPI